MIRIRQCRPEAWNDLQLPDGHKSLVQSLIESHIMGNLSRKLQFDLVRAKGMSGTVCRSYHKFRCLPNLLRKGSSHPATWCSRRWEDIHGR
jgi:hypothetical protein